jgi:hypothetical protein
MFVGTLSSEQTGFGLLISVGDAAARQIIGGHLYADAIAHQNAYAVLAHLAGNRCQNDMRAVVELDFKKGVGLFVDYRALRGNQIISGQ